MIDEEIENMKQSLLSPKKWGILARLILTSAIGASFSVFGQSPQPIAAKQIENVRGQESVVKTLSLGAQPDAKQRAVFISRMIGEDRKNEVTWWIREIGQTPSQHFVGKKSVRDWLRENKSGLVLASGDPNSLHGESGLGFEGFLNENGISLDSIGELNRYQFNVTRSDHPTGLEGSILRISRFVPEEGSSKIKAIYYTEAGIDFYHPENWGGAIRARIEDKTIARSPSPRMYVDKSISSTGKQFRAFLVPNLRNDDSYCRLSDVINEACIPDGGVALLKYYYVEN